MTSDMVERVAQAMREAVITDDEGEFPRLFDLLDFSGENKARTVVNGLARAAITAMREPTPAMIDRFVSRALSVSIHSDGGWSGYAREQWQTMIDGALNGSEPDEG